VIAEFPMDSLSGSNPRPSEFTALPEKFFGGSTKYDDGSVDAMMQHGGNGQRTWILVYNLRGANALAHAAILDAHFASAKWLEDEGMSAYSFNFRERSDVGSTLYSNVRYTKYEVSHTKTHIQTRIVELTRFP
jgi:hypothetical protein